MNTPSKNIEDEKTLCPNFIIVIMSLLGILVSPLVSIAFWFYNRAERLQDEARKEGS
jgi:hypothetical protein